MAARPGGVLTRVDQRRPYPPALPGRGHFQMIEQRYARELAPQLRLLMDLAIEVDVADHVAVEPRHEEFADALPRPPDPVGEKVGLTHRGHQGVQVALVRDPYLQPLRRPNRP